MIPESPAGNDSSQDETLKVAGVGAKPPPVVNRPGAAFTPMERQGDLIGHYKLLQELGRGGFGVVWHAEQTEPIHREVALKVIKPGMDTGEVIARFESERQALALMDHPNIAGVLDAGATASGRPYFVMELVKGVPITEYCDAHKLSIRHRLELFIPVCQAVQHAHQKAILHRDLKPANILVTEVDGRPVPKVIDFGIAKALGITQEEVFNASLAQTQQGAIVGTLQYMSPEQAGSVSDVDTRSDIYTLGVILYELLVGDTPLSREQMIKAALDEVLKLVREAEPKRPSSRFIPVTDVAKTTASMRLSEPKKLGHELRGDLDWIVLKALEKDRSRRYDSANAFALDLQRHLKDEPVSAGPPSAGYRLRKLIKRNKRAFMTAATISACLAAGIIATSIALRRETVQKQLAEHAQGTAEGQISYLLYEMQDKLEPLGRLDLLDDVSKEAEKFFENLPSDQQTPETLGNQGMMFIRRGDVLEAQGKLPEARAAFEKSLEIFEPLAQKDHTNSLWQKSIVRGNLRLGGLATAQGDLKAADKFYELAMEVCGRIAQELPTDVDWQRRLLISHIMLGDFAMKKGDLKAARFAYEKSLDIQERALRNAPTNTQLHSDCGLSYMKLGALATAERNFKAARVAFEKALAITEGDAKEDPNNAGHQQNLATVFVMLGQMASHEGDQKAARIAVEKGLAILERLSQSDPSNAMRQRDLSATYCALADVAKSQGELNTARTIVKKSLIYLERLAQSDPSNCEWQWDLSQAYTLLGTIAFAQKDMKEARVSNEKRLTNLERLIRSHPDNIKWQKALSTGYAVMGYLASVEGDLQRALAFSEKCFMMRNRLAESDPGNAGGQSHLAANYKLEGILAQSAGDSKAARVAHEKALVINQRLVQRDPHDAGLQHDLAATYNSLGALEQSDGDLKAARFAFAQSLTIYESLAKKYPLDSSRQHDVASSHLMLAWVALKEHNEIAAREAIEKHHAIIRRLTQGDPNNAEWRKDLGVACAMTGGIAQSENDLKKAREYLEESESIFLSLATTDPSNTEWQGHLATSHEALGDLAEAEGNFKEARAAHKKAITILGQLALKEPGKAERQRKLSECCVKMGNMDLAEGDFAAALETYEKAQEAFERDSQNDSAKAVRGRKLEESIQQLAEVFEAIGDLLTARRAYGRQREVTSRLLKIMPGAPGMGEALGHACAKEAEMVAKLEPEASSTNVRAILEDGRAQLNKLRNDGKLSTADTMMLRYLEIKLDGPPKKSEQVTARLRKDGSVDAVTRIPQQAPPASKELGSDLLQSWNLNAVPKVPDAKMPLLHFYRPSGQSKQTYSSPQTKQNPSWTTPFPPHKIAGKLYYVGSQDLASYLIATPEGHILINSSLEESVPLIRASIEKLGFKFTDVKILLISHAHSDHCAGSAEIIKQTGAKYMVMEPDVPAVENGGTRSRLGSYTQFPPAKVDRTLKDGDEVKLGGSVLVAHLTPGHTRGCTTWTVKVDGLNAVIIGSPNVIPGYILVNNKDYPSIATDYEQTFRVLKALPVDLFLGAHGGYYGMEAKHARLKSDGPNPFVDVKGYHRYVSDREQAFRAELEKQKMK